MGSFVNCGNGVKVRGWQKKGKGHWRTYLKFPPNSNELFYLIYIFLFSFKLDSFDPLDAGHTLFRFFKM